VIKDSSQAPEQNDWKEFRPLFGGGKIKICDTLRAVTPFGGLSVFIEFLSRIELVEQLTNRGPYQPKSANHYEPGQILVGFILSVIVGARRLAHANQLRADRALQALLGLKRFPSDDTILNYFRRFSQAEIERFWRPLWRWLKNELAADRFCLRSFFATESAFLAVLFSFNLLSEFQRAIDPALKTYKQPATLRFEVFTCGAILGRSGHHLVLHMSKNWGGYSERKALFNNLLYWPSPTSPNFDPPIENAA
jgi:hypothetical protein